MAELIYLFTALASLLVLIWAVLVLLILRAWQRELDYTARRRGRNLPPPDLLPMPPATGAQRIYRGGMWREKGSDVWHPIGVPLGEGHTQRGNGSGGPSTPKPPIKPQPSGGRMIDQSGMTISYQPLPRSGRTIPPPRKPDFPPPRVIREDFLP